MNEFRERDTFFNRGRWGGDMPGTDASSSAWGAYHSGREQRHFDRQIEELRRADQESLNDMWKRTSSDY